jgi:hypothetical protein
MKMGAWRAAYQKPAPTGSVTATNTIGNANFGQDNSDFYA